MFLKATFLFHCLLIKHQHHKHHYSPTPFTIIHLLPLFTTIIHCQTHRHDYTIETKVHSCGQGKTSTVPTIKHYQWSKNSNISMKNQYSSIKHLHSQQTTNVLHQTPTLTIKPQHFSQWNTNVVQRHQHLLKKNKQKKQHSQQNTNAVHQTPTVTTDIHHLLVVFLSLSWDLWGFTAGILLQLIKT